MPTPAERANLIKQGTEKARKDFLIYTVEQEKAIYGLLQQSADNIATRIARAEALGKIPPARLTPLLDNIKTEMAALRPAIKGQIVRGMSNSVNLGMQAAVKGMAGAELAGGIKTSIGTAFIGKDGKLRRYDAKEEAYKDSKWGRINKGAMTALLKFQPGGITLSDRVWDMTWAAEKAMRNQLQMAVLQGDSAARLSRDIRGFLSQPLTLRGKIKQAYHPGVGVFKSAYGNAMRFARTELNRAFNEGAFRYAADKDWVAGYIWRVGGAEPCPDCEELDGTEYAKGDEPEIPLHPNCYDKDTEVYTNKGWKLFKDLQGNEKILSLIPDSFNLEFLPIKHKIEYRFEGKLVHFHNRNFDLLVTPNHRMFAGKRNFINDRRKKKFSFVEAKDLNGEYHIYRSSVWKGIDKEFVKIGEETIETELFCKFMGWYLSEGSVCKRKGCDCWQIVISQWGNKLKKLQEDLKGLPYRVKNFTGGIRIYDKELGKYLLKFGKSFEKYVPEEIKELPADKIRIFLDAYCLGDGHRRKGKKWKGGNFRDDIVYTTSSKRMADDIGELILKAGSRPSYCLQKTKGKEIQHKNGKYVGNYDIWRISECYSQYAVKVKKTEVDYSGNVYDVELPKHHILYVRRNGKCCWSGNCMCYLELVTDETKGAEAKVEEPVLEKPPEYQSFTKPEDRNKFVDKEFSGWKAGLESNQAEALDKYSRTAFMPINNTLRGVPFPGQADPAYMARTRTQIKVIDQALMKHTSGENLTLFRSIDRKTLPDINKLKGTILTDKGFVSTSFRKEVAEGWRERGGVVVEMLVPKGTNMGFLGGREAEVLLTRNTKLKITDVWKLEGKVNRITAEVIK